MQIDLFEIYEARQDTDAAVIRVLERKVREAESFGQGVSRSNAELHNAITAAGFKYESWPESKLIPRDDGPPVVITRVEQ